MASAHGYPDWHVYEILKLTGIVPNLQDVEKPENAVLTPNVDCSKVQSMQGEGLGIQLTDPAQTLQDMLISMKTSHAAYL